MAQPRRHPVRHLCHHDLLPARRHTTRPATDIFLEEKRGDCTLVHRFELVYGAAVPITLNSEVICAGQSVTLAPTPAGGGGATYLWQGLAD